MAISFIFILLLGKKYNPIGHLIMMIWLLYSSEIRFEDYELWFSEGTKELESNAI